MNFVTNRRTAYCLCGLVLFTICGCGWHEVTSFPSPSGRHTVYVQQPRGWNELGARVVLKSGQLSKVVNHFKGDAHITFAHCWWSPDESTFAVFLAGSFRLITAYDITNGRTLEGSDWQTKIGHDIARSYGLSAETTAADALQWALSSPGLTAFRVRHKH